MIKLSTCVNTFLNILKYHCFFKSNQYFTEFQNKYNLFFTNVCIVTLLDNIVYIFLPTAAHLDIFAKGGADKIKEWLNESRF